MRIPSVVAVLLSLSWAVPAKASYVLFWSMPATTGEVIHFDLVASGADAFTSAYVMPPGKAAFTVSLTPIDVPETSVGAFDFGPFTVGGLYYFEFEPVAGDTSALGIWPVSVDFAPPPFNPLLSAPVSLGGHLFHIAAPLGAAVGKQVVDLLSGVTIGTVSPDGNIDAGPLSPGVHLLGVGPPGAQSVVTLDVPVPEPAALVLLGTALAGLGLARRR